MTSQETDFNRVHDDVAALSQRYVPFQGTVKGVAEGQKEAKASPKLFQYYSSAARMDQIESEKRYPALDAIRKLIVAAGHGAGEAVEAVGIALENTIQNSTHHWHTDTQHSGKRYNFPVFRGANDGMRPSLKTLTEGEAKEIKEEVGDGLWTLGFTSLLGITSQTQVPQVYADLCRDKTLNDPMTIEEMGSLTSVYNSVVKSTTPHEVESHPLWLIEKGSQFLAASHKLQEALVQLPPLQMLNRGDFEEFKKVAAQDWDTYVQSDEMQAHMPEIVAATKDYLKALEGLCDGYGWDIKEVMQSNVDKITGWEESIAAGGQHDRYNAPDEQRTVISFKPGELVYN